MYWVYVTTDELCYNIKQGNTNVILGDKTWSKELDLLIWKQHFDTPPFEFISEVKCPV